MWPPTMANETFSIGELAELARSSTDEVLLSLWYGGLFEIADSPSAVLSGEALKKALNILNLATKSSPPTQK